MRAFFFVAPVFALVAACGGAKEYAMVGSAKVDSVHGVLEVEPAEGSKRALTLVLDELPPPDRLGEEFTTYVAWTKPLEGAPRALGALEYSREERQGRLSATGPSRSFTFLVTAESSASPEAPSSLVVAEHRVAREN